MSSDDKTVRSYSNIRRTVGGGLACCCFTENDQRETSLIQGCVSRELEQVRGELWHLEATFLGRGVQAPRWECAWVSQAQ